MTRYASHCRREHEGRSRQDDNAIHLAAGLANEGHQTAASTPIRRATSVTPLAFTATRRFGTSCSGRRLSTSAGPRRREHLDVLPSNAASFGLDAQLPARRSAKPCWRAAPRPDRVRRVVVDSSPPMSLLTTTRCCMSTTCRSHWHGRHGDRRRPPNAQRHSRDPRALPNAGLDLLAVLPVAVNTTTNATRAAFEALEDDPEMRSICIVQGSRPGDVTT